ncbi:hypothetical protein L7F22_014393 [Adiantum nelumboides]|nr:hypothetical protein [Adiantum nelumboides]
MVRLLQAEKKGTRAAPAGDDHGAGRGRTGRSNPMSAIAKAIRLHFLNHAFVKIGVSYRPRGASVQDVVEELEDLTGGTAYAQDDFRVILYRGWPSGEDMPLDGLYDVLSPEQCEILEDEERVDDEEESMTVSTLTEAARQSREDEENGEDKDAKDEEWDMLLNEDDDEEWDNLSDGEGDEEEDDEYRSEVTSVKGLESSDDEDVDRDLRWDKFSDKCEIVHDDKDEPDWSISYDASVAGADDSHTSMLGKTHADHNDDSDWGHEHVKNSPVDNNQSSGNSSFKEDVEVDDSISMAGNIICKGAGAMALGFDAEEDGESFFIQENGSFTDSRFDYGSFLAGVTYGAGGDQMGLDFVLDEDV